MWIAGDPPQAEGMVIQTNGNSKRDQDLTAFWVCLRKSRDALAAKAECLSKDCGDMGIMTMEAIQQLWLLPWVRIECTEHRRHSDLCFRYSPLAFGLRTNPRGQVY